MKQNKKPTSHTEPASSERDYSKEILGSLPGAPTEPISNENLNLTTPASATPPTPHESTWQLLIKFILSSRLAKIITGVFFLCLFAQFVNLTTFGVRGFALGILLVYLSREINQEFLKPLDRGEKPNTQWIGILLLPTLIIGFFEVGFLWKQHVATEITREISGNPNAWAECQRFTPALFADALSAGYYAPAQNSDKAVVQYVYCKEWGNFVFANKNSIEDLQTLWSLGTVIHEAVHVSGEYNEAVTQCLTLRAFPYVLRQFDVSEDKVQEYTSKYTQGSLRMASNYRNGECSNHPIIARLPHIFGPKTPD